MTGPPAIVSPHQVGLTRVPEFGYELDLPIATTALAPLIKQWLDSAIRDMVLQVVWGGMALARKVQQLCSLTWPCTTAEPGVAATPLTAALGAARALLHAD